MFAPVSQQRQVVHMRLPSLRKWQSTTNDVEANSGPRYGIVLDSSKVMIFAIVPSFHEHCRFITLSSVSVCSGFCQAIPQSPRKGKCAPQRVRVRWCVRSSQNPIAKVRKQELNKSQNPFLGPMDRYHLGVQEQLSELSDAWFHQDTEGLEPLCAPR